ncbi:MAG: NifB/NifX family molybdenum-iron cluster-binding protein [Psychrilyobacter sp.]|nr:NifB/NifX family molybdenum-iron cluster-binding protein [Psychrilyobacter sp.]
MELRIVFPTNDRLNIEEHFGHCTEFKVLNTKDGEVVSEEFLTPPPHAPGVLPKFLGEHKVTTIITGGMGAMAIKLFKAQDIDVILGAKGTILDNLKTFLEGELASNGTSCSHTHGDHQCNN